jgi:hypothetical protein
MQGSVPAVRRDSQGFGVGGSFSSFVLVRTLLDGRSVFPIANPAMKGKPDESADAMGHRPDGLIVSPSVVPDGDI